MYRITPENYGRSTVTDALSDAAYAIRIGIVKAQEAAEYGIDATTRQLGRSQAKKLGKLLAEVESARANWWTTKPDAVIGGEW